MAYIQYLLVLCVSFSIINGANILVLWMSTPTSHWTPVEPLLKELASRGHHVTVFSSHPQKTPLANYTDVDFSDRRPLLKESILIDDVRKDMTNKHKYLTRLLNRYGDLGKIVRYPEFQTLLNSKDQFDLLVTEIFVSDLFTYFSYKLNIPLVSFTTCVNMPWASERTGIPDNPSYIPNALVNFNSDMDFWQRAQNAAILIYAKIRLLWIFAKETQTSLEAEIGGRLPSLDEVLVNTSLVLLNSYHALSQSRPFPPNVVEVGGIHLKQRKQLSEDFQQILNASEHGVIVMSFGSLVRTSTLPKSTILMFMGAFAKIRQTVLFKYEEELPEAPPNVIVRKWLPQRDLVEEERVVAVIGHGGLHSTIEAVHFGKPLVGVPFFGDQPVNVAAVERRGAGLSLDIDRLTQPQIEHALDQVINNPKYKENMQQLSLQFRDRPMSPLDTAVFWIEYVIRHKGAHHLRPASVHLPFYQYLLLDVAALFIAIIATILYVTYFISKRLYRLLYRRFKSPEETMSDVQEKKIN